MPPQLIAQSKGNPQKAKQESDIWLKLSSDLIPKSMDLKHISKQIKKEMDPEKKRELVLLYNTKESDLKSYMNNLVKISERYKNIPDLSKIGAFYNDKMLEKKMSYVKNS